MLDRDLADLYGVPTKRLNEAVRRNRSRFPDKFMFQLSAEEGGLMRSQFATASKTNLRYQPLVFTEHGVVMLSAVLRSQRAIQMSILVVDAFVRMRELIAANRDIAARVEANSHPVPQALCDRANLDGGREVQQLMQEAGHVYLTSLVTLKR